MMVWMREVTVLLQELIGTILVCCIQLWASQKHSHIRLYSKGNSLWRRKLKIVFTEFHLKELEISTYRRDNSWARIVSFILFIRCLKGYEVEKKSDMFSWMTVLEIISWCYEKEILAQYKEILACFREVPQLGNSKIGWKTTGLDT